jgi:hypothetical protein
MNMNKTIKKKVNLINSSQNEGSSPSCIALSFDGFGSILWSVIGFFGSFTVFHNFCFSDCQLFRPKYRWRDLISRNIYVSGVSKIVIVLVLHFYNPERLGAYSSWFVDLSVCQFVYLCMSDVCLRMSGCLSLYVCLSVCLSAKTLTLAISFEW